MSAPTPVPYVALGDSLTAGMQSMGLAAISQAYSFPKQIADFLGATPFTQPAIKGWLPGRAPAGQRDGWVGNPPNQELVLRRAEALLATRSGGKLPAPGAWRELHDEVEAVAAVLREAITDYVRAVEDAQLADLLVEPMPPGGYYQNLGIPGLATQDLSTVNFAKLRASLRLSFGQRLARLARHALNGVSDALHGATRAQPSLLQALTQALLTVGEHDFGARMHAQIVAAVLCQGTSTALDAARAQQPHMVTLLVGNNDIINTMCDAHIWDGDTPLYTPPDIFRDRLAALVDQVLAFASQPYLFLATLPSPTASPNLLRNRLGHWKSMLPSAAFLVDAQLLEVEMVVAQYNAAIREVAAQRPGRVWLVDVHALQERMQRGTRNDAEMTRRVITHAVRADLLPPQAARAVLAAARAGNLATIRHAQEVDSHLAARSFTEVSRLTPESSGAYLAHPQLSTLPGEANVNAFIVRLASGQTYRLTGEYLAADDTGTITAGGAVSLDAIHLTNTGYAYVAREFLSVIYAADAETHGAVLRGLPGQQKTPAQFDAELLRVAQEDTLLNGVPRLLPAVMDATGAAANLLGDLHYSDPYLTR